MKLAYLLIGIIATGLGAISCFTRSTYNALSVVGGLLFCEKFKTFSHMADADIHVSKSFSQLC